MPRGGARPGAGRKRKNNTTGQRVEFTPEQLKSLLESPHIAYISRKTISYTLAFKEMFWLRYCDGIDPKQIFQDAGLDTNIIDRTRINSLIKLLKARKEKGLPFSDGKEPQLNQSETKLNFPTPPRQPKNSKKLVLSSDDISKMYHQVAYMSQELEFIKKIILAEKEGK